MQQSAPGAWGGWRSRAAAAGLGEAADEVALKVYTYVHDFLDIRTSAGEDTIDLSDALVGGRFSVDTGDNDDTIDIAQVSAGRVIVEGVGTVRIGRGDDSMKIGMLAYPAISARFLAPAVFDGGPGTDTLDHTTGGNIYSEGLTETSWETVI